MTYLEFKQAAKKHYKTSKCLYEKCDNSNWQIQENIFYLCGYVIEMMIKYQIFVSIGYDRSKNIDEINIHGITKQNILRGKKAHNIFSLSQLLKKYRGDKIIDEIIDNFTKWDVSIRYNGKKENYDTLRLDINNLLILSQKVIEELGR